LFIKTVVKEKRTKKIKSNFFIVSSLRALMIIPVYNPICVNW
jgi:hypothetical protein